MMTRLILRFIPQHMQVILREMRRGSTSISLAAFWHVVLKMPKAGRQPWMLCMGEKNFQSQVCQSVFLGQLKYTELWIGLIVREKNYLTVFIYDKWVGHHIPAFEEGEEFEPTVCEIREGQTSQPNYLTEADLVTLMDKNGIGMLWIIGRSCANVPPFLGTDATIAQHIQTIIDREYVIERMEGGVKYLVPSTLGIGLIEGYNRIGLAKNVSKPQLRREVGTLRNPHLRLKKMIFF